MTTTRTPRRQSGLTLIEFMVSITIGMLMVAAMATLIADQSSNRSETDKSGRLIENGRYAIRTIADDLQMGGYWGELNAIAVPTVVPDPCVATVAAITDGMRLHVQGFAPPGSGATGYNPSSNTAAAPSCVTNYKAGTDVLVVRHADPDSSDVESAPGVLDPTKVATNRIYLQTGLQATGTQFTSALDSGSNLATAFTLLKKDKATLATLRKVLVRIYYVSTCSVCSGASADTTPTLKMVELTAGPAMSAPISIAEGVENLQVDYGLDSDGDGTANGADSAGDALVLADWPNVMSARINLLVRSPEVTPGYVDAKTYNMGAVGSTAAANDGYKRHVFVQSVRLVNPSGRRAP